MDQQINKSSKYNIILLSLFVLLILGISGIFLLLSNFNSVKTWFSNRLGQGVERLSHTIYLGVLEDPDKDKDGLEDSVAEKEIYKTDPKIKNSNDTSLSDGLYIYSIYKKAYGDNDKNALDQLSQYKTNFESYKLLATPNIVNTRTLKIASLEEIFNFRSLETYNFYVGMSEDLTKIVRQALNLRTEGKYDESLKLLQNEIQKNPNSSILKYHLALTYHRMKEYKSALSIYEGIITDPIIQSPLIYSDIASANYSLGNEDKFIEYMNLSIKKFPEDLNQYLTLSLFYEEKNLMDKAEEILNQGLKIEPRYASYYNELAIIAGLKGDNKKEFELYQKAVSYDFRYARGHQNLAILYEEYYDKPKDGLLEARIAWDLDPTPYHLAQVILLYNKTGDVSEAQRLEKELLKMKDIDGVSFNNLGRLYLDKENYKQAEFYFRKAIEVAPTLSNAYNNLGIVLSDTNRNEEASINYKKAIEINPNYANAYSNLGIYYTDIKSYQKAIESFQEAIRINPGLYRPYGNIASVYYTLGDKPSAKKYYQKAYDLGSREWYVVDRLKELANY